MIGATFPATGRSGQSCFRILIKQTMLLDLPDAMNRYRELRTRQVIALAVKWLRREFSLKLADIIFCRTTSIPIRVY